jgi:hypothetical protein
MHIRTPGGGCAAGRAQAQEAAQLLVDTVEEPFGSGSVATAWPLDAAPTTTREAPQAALLGHERRALLIELQPRVQRPCPSSSETCSTVPAGVSVLIVMRTSQSMGARSDGNGGGGTPRPPVRHLRSRSSGGRRRRAGVGDTTVFAIRRWVACRLVWGPNPFIHEER